MSIVFMKVSVTSTVICVDIVLSSSLDRLSDADFTWTPSVPKMTQIKVSQKLGSVVLVVKSMLRAEAATC